MLFCLNILPRFSSDYNIPLPDFSNTVTQAAFKVVATLPGIIQAEDYDVGGQSVSYSGFRGWCCSPFQTPSKENASHHHNYQYCDANTAKCST